MIAYQYDDQSGIYIGSMECQKHPFKDEFLRPSNTVIEAPPTDDVGKWRLVDGKWQEYIPPKLPDPEPYVPVPVQEIIERVRGRQSINQDEFLELLIHILDRLDD